MDPQLLDIADSFETQRLLIRAPRAGDGAEMNAAKAGGLRISRRW